MAEKTTSSQNSANFESSIEETEFNPTMSSFGSDNSTFQLSIEKLNGRNYKNWAQSIKLVIDGEGKTGYLTEKQNSLRTKIFKRGGNLKTLWLWPGL